MSPHYEAAEIAGEIAEKDSTHELLKEQVEAHLRGEDLDSLSDAQAARIGRTLIAIVTGNMEARDEFLRSREAREASAVDAGIKGGA